MTGEKLAVVVKCSVYEGGVKCHPYFDIVLIGFEYSSTVRSLNGPFFIELGGMWCTNAQRG